MRPLGIIALIFGAFFLFVSYLAGKDSGFLFGKMFRFSIFLLSIGIAFVIFTGKPQNRTKTDLKNTWENAPTLHKVAWIIAAVGGFILAQILHL